MSHAVFDTVAVDMLAGPDGPQRHMLRANGSTLVKPGYISVYQEGADDVKADDDDHVLPAMNEGDDVALAAFKAEQHFTEPPPRFSEASLVKALEEHGIGRPSTYATIISTLQDREYVEMDNRRFIPTDIGKIVGKFLTTYFHRYVEYGFTAALEDELDAVSRGEEVWTLPLQKFWKPFINEVERIEKTVSREQVAMARELGTDPVSGKPKSVRMGRFGPFVQIGTKDDEEKPKFAGLRPGQKMDSITMEQAIELFKLPRTIGKTAEGDDVVTNVGTLRPVHQVRRQVCFAEGRRPVHRRVARALELIRLKQEGGRQRLIADFPSDGIQVLNGALRSVRHERQEEREDSERSRAEVDHYRRGASDDRAGARARHRPVRSRQGDPGPGTPRQRRLRPMAPGKQRRKTPLRSRPRQRARLLRRRSLRRRRQLRRLPAPLAHPRRRREGRGERRAQREVRNGESTCAQDGHSRGTRRRRQAQSEGIPIAGVAAASSGPDLETAQIMFSLAACDIGIKSARDSLAALNKSCCGRSLRRAPHKPPDVPEQDSRR